MKFLANENFPGDAVDALRQADHAVLWIRTEAPGSKDEDILASASQQDRILLTFDKDFGELAFHSRLPASCGIILFRFQPRSPAFIVEMVLKSLASRNDWTGHFAVVEENRIRMRSLPS